MYVRLVLVAKVRISEESETLVDWGRKEGP